ncbi:hypothetical protein A1O3_08002 [Capronia epimyces CBS 606.96]|uniref:rRNA biogenesis protein RRP36 n=1 Tax=Capronia epimyces CBS 606.96 TaxID=1182542 RepID=W9YBH2_9EURO|nr:uncharacterized protein A1O3_08002 [Capronia epimyces CBS 606.96]EXJ79719.1 hypothetical protein A1O3_08002 [Capronia epimyces CBS 606.96]
MAYVSVMDRPVQVRHDYDEDVELASSDQEVSDDDHSDNSESAQTESDSQTGKEDADELSLSGSEEDVPLNEISFGALAKAQEKFQPKSRKRKLAETLGDPVPGNGGNNEEETFNTRQRAKEPRVDAPKRSSKHAPAIESARKPVSRKRTIFEPPPTLKFRDPRFDPTVMSSNRDPNTLEKANKNYSFLTTYQAAEILELKAQIKKTKDPEVIANLKRQVMSIESKIRNSEARQRENEIRKKHKQQQKAALRTGEKSKPYYLKEAEVKKLAKEEKLQSMGKRARDKAEKRRQKREKGKDAKDMPRARREG